jgi:hypothetical protein
MTMMDLNLRSAPRRAFFRVHSPGWSCKFTGKVLQSFLVCRERRSSRKKVRARHPVDERYAC